MKPWNVKLLTFIALSMTLLLAFSLRIPAAKKAKIPFEPPKGCVFRTVMGEEVSVNHSIYKTPEHVLSSVNNGLDWISKAQNKNGGWGAGTHYRQDITDLHAVEADPATTAMVAMALLRSGSTLSSGRHSSQLSKALEYILTSVETSKPESTNITTQTGTQIQTKLGANIDVILASQFLSNITPHTADNDDLAKRVARCQDICVAKIQKAQDGNGKISGAGWAGVLQSSFATNALESAEANGAAVDTVALERAKEYQKQNYDPKTGNVNTDKGAGVVLYAVTGSARASAKEARKVEEEIRKAKDEGRLEEAEAASPETLRKIGFGETEAIKYATSYEVYQSAKVQAQRDDVIDGFGNNGGEEFLSYLQTGESMIINKDNSWQNWYDNMSGRILKIQNNDGSWSGHHCITSPVFCTATCLLILAINNDVETLTKIGADH